MSQKHPDIFDCTLKKDCQMLIIFDTNIPDTVDDHSFFLSHPTSAPALPGENRTNETLHFYPKQYYHLIKITYKNIYFVDISLTLADSSSNYPFFQLPTVKNVGNVDQLCEHRHGDASPFFDSSVDDVLLHTHTDFTSRFLNSSTFLDVIQ